MLWRPRPFSLTFLFTSIIPLTPRSALPSLRKARCGIVKLLFPGRGARTATLSVKRSEFGKRESRLREEEQMRERKVWKGRRVMAVTEGESLPPVNNASHLDDPSR